MNGIAAYIVSWFGNSQMLLPGRLGEQTFAHAVCELITSQLHIPQAKILACLFKLDLPKVIIRLPQRQILKFPKNLFYFKCDIIT